MSQKIRIKDIAEKAGVSIGTVDRVLHKRPNVSKAALERVNKALAEMNYHPNVYASALAYHKSYTFHLIIPAHSQETYWTEIEDGAKDAIEHRNDFNIKLRIHYYERFKDNSFKETAGRCLNSDPNGVVVVPATLQATKEFTDQLHEKKIPFVMLDSYMPDLKPLSFYGQDSFRSGYFAATMLMLIANKEKQIAIMRRVKEGNVNSKQQANREVGFRHYMSDHYPGIEILQLDIPVGVSQDEVNRHLDEFLDEHPGLHHCITFGSNAYIIGEYLLNKNRRDMQIMGYDVVAQNTECLKEGSISFLIAQHAYQQGWSSFDTLFKAIVLKQKIEPVNYMPIELLSKDNIDFYSRTSK